MKTYTLSFLKYIIRVTPDVPSAVAFCDNQEIVLSHEEMRGITGDHKKVLFDLLVKLWEKLLPMTDRPAELAPMCTLSNYTIEENATISTRKATEPFNQDKWYKESLEKLEAVLGPTNENKKESVQFELF
jgi:hypothetical protein